MSVTIRTFVALKYTSKNGFRYAKYPLVTSARITHLPSIWTLGSIPRACQDFIGYTTSRMKKWSFRCFITLQMFKIFLDHGTRDFYFVVIKNRYHVSLLHLVIHPKNQRMPGVNWRMDQVSGFKSEWCICQKCSYWPYIFSMKSKLFKFQREKEVKFTSQWSTKIW